MNRYIPLLKENKYLKQFISTGFKTPNWIKIYTKKGYQYAYMIELITIKMLQKTINGEKGVDRFSSKDIKYEKIELKSHLNLIKQLEDYTKKQNIQLKKFKTENYTFFELDELIRNLHNKYKKDFSTNFDELV